MQQREQERKIRDLEKQQQHAKELAEQEAEKKLNKMKDATDYEDKNFIIRQAETDEEKRVREEAKKKKFYEEFKPDFDLDEVPDLE